MSSSEVAFLRVFASLVRIASPIVISLLTICVGLPINNGIGIPEIIGEALTDVPSWFVSLREQPGKEKVGMAPPA